MTFSPDRISDGDRDDRGKKSANREQDGLRKQKTRREEYNAQIEQQKAQVIKDMKES